MDGISGKRVGEIAGIGGAHDGLDTRNRAGGVLAPDVAEEEDLCAIGDLLAEEADGLHEVHVLTVVVAGRRPVHGADVEDDVGGLHDLEGGVVERRRLVEPRAVGDGDAALAHAQHRLHELDLGDDGAVPQRWRQVAQHGELQRVRDHPSTLQPGISVGIPWRQRVEVQQQLFGREIFTRKMDGWRGRKYRWSNRW